jgi:hypothetical protein
LGNGKISEFKDISQWESLYFQDFKSSVVPEKKKILPNAQTKDLPKPKVSYKDRREYELMEAKILAQEELLASLNEELEKSVGAGVAPQLYEKIAQAQSLLDSYYHRWSELEELLA